ncbi:hypothetical protein [Rhodococcus wratislaviensis]|uniref:hypothetical protein n=1 Tax=Rhodococcus wratislaviensis TaxID=44752 RepID=UPI003663F84E
MYARPNRRAVLLGLLGGGLAAAMQSYTDLTHPAVGAASPIPGLPEGLVPNGLVPDGLLPAPPRPCRIRCIPRAHQATASSTRH